jgi:hypothetical protein
MLISNAASISELLGMKGSISSFEPTHAAFALKKLYGLLDMGTPCTRNSLQHQQLTLHPEPYTINPKP